MEEKSRMMTIKFMVGMGESENRVDDKGMEFEPGVERMKCFNLPAETLEKGR